MTNFGPIEVSIVQVRHFIGCKHKNTFLSWGDRWLLAVNFLTSLSCLPNRDGVWPGQGSGGGSYPCWGPPSSTGQNVGLLWRPPPSSYFTGSEVGLFGRAAACGAYNTGASHQIPPKTQEENKTQPSTCRFPSAINPQLISNISPNLTKLCNLADISSPDIANKKFNVVRKCVYHYQIPLLHCIIVVPLNVKYLYQYCS